MRMPEEVKVTNLTSHMIMLEWKQPQTGPKPESYRVAYTNLMTSDAVQVCHCFDSCVQPRLVVVVGG